METWLPWLIVSTLLLLAFVSVVAMMTIWFRQERTMMNQQFLSWMVNLSTETTKMLSTQTEATERLVDKAMALAKSGDPLAFQSIQAMGTTPSAYDEPYDPSPEGEIARIEARQKGVHEQDGDLNGSEEEFLAGLYDAPGNEFFTVDGREHWSGTGTDSVS